VTAGTSLLSGPASLTAKAVSSGLSIGANTLGQLSSDDPFSYQSLFIAGFGGWKSAGAGYRATVGISTGTAYMDSVLAGKDPTYATIGAAFGSSLGYGTAYGVTKILGQREISRRASISMSDNAFKYLDEPIRPGSFIHQGMEIGPYPGIWGGAAGSGFSEAGSREMTDLVTPKTDNKK